MPPPKHRPSLPQVTRTRQPSTTAGVATATSSSLMQCPFAPERKGSRDITAVVVSRKSASAVQPSPTRFIEAMLENDDSSSDSGDDDNDTSSRDNGELCGAAGVYSVSNSGLTWGLLLAEGRIHANMTSHGFVSGRGVGFAFTQLGCCKTQVPTAILHPSCPVWCRRLPQRSACPSGLPPSRLTMLVTTTATTG